MPLALQSKRTRELENESKRLLAMSPDQAEKALMSMPEDKRDLLMMYSKLQILQKRYDYMTKVRRSRVHTEADFNFLKNEIEKLEKEIEEFI